MFTILGVFDWFELLKKFWRNPRFHRAEDFHHRVSFGDGAFVTQGVIVERLAGRYGFNASELGGEYTEAHELCLKRCLKQKILSYVLVFAI